MDKVYVVLKNGEPIEAGELSPELWEEYEKSGEEILRYSAGEKILISEDLEAIQDWMEQCMEVYFTEDEITMGELHLVVDEKSWN